MKIGISTGNFHDSRALRDNRTLYREEGYRRMKAAGFDCADLNALGPTSNYFYTLPLEEAIEDAKEERRIAEEAGIRIHQVHGPWPTYDTTEELRQQKLVFMERAIRLTPAFGSRYLVIHPDLPFGWDEELDPAFTRETNLKMFKALLPIAEEENVIICLENMPTEPYTISPSSEIYKLVSEINHPNLRMCFDTGHANVFGDDCGDVVRLIEPVLKVLHVHDNMGVRDEHLLPYEGTINWDSFTKGLKDIGFSGVFSIESTIRVDSMYDPEHFKSACHFASIARTLADKSTQS